MQRYASILTAGLLAATASAQFTLVTPNGYASTVGNTNNAYPWNRGTASMRIQFLIDSTHFTAQGVVSPILISKLRYRPYPGAVTSWAGGSWPNVRIDMATSPLDWAVASTTFANNLGPDLTTVLNGPVTVTGGSTLGTGIVVPWHIDIPLTTNFIYDPTTGNDLTVDIYLDGTGWTGTSRAADHVSTVGAALGCRVYNTTGIAATTGTVTTSYGAVTEFTYVPANGLFAGFSANVTGGASPLQVQFTSNSYSSDPGGITSYAWDFDGDSIVDSTAQNPPPFTYTNCGSYSPSLTVTDASHPPSTLTRTNYIVTDLIAANFTHQVIGPLTVQFTDTSNMPASSWSWDLNGDSVPDSNVQNPVWVYPNTNPVNVSLTVTRLCSPPSTTTKSVIAAQTLTTNLAVNNGVGTPATLYFNLDVLNPVGVSISSFDTITQTISTPFTADWYMKIGTYVGSELNPAPWTLLGTASGTTAPTANLPANSAFPTPLYIPQGSYGVAIRYVGAYPRYVTQTALTTWSNGDLSLTAGAASLSTAGAFTGTNLNSPRSWAGTLYYGTNNVTNLAGYGWFGPGCPGSLGPISVVATTQPQIGGTLSTNLNNLQNGIAVMVIGLNNGPPLPIDLGFLGAPGCPLRVSLDVTDTVIGIAPNASWNFSIPANPLLNGFKLYNQAASLDTINAFGFALSNAYGWVVGN
jgi:PKD repeat protein